MNEPNKHAMKSKLLKDIGVIERKIRALKEEMKNKAQKIFLIEQSIKQDKENISSLESDNIKKRIQLAQVTSE